ncbi:MAG: type II toxin-antitoxin system VapC family toxin [Egibacteraceae bacterium]
MLLAVDASTVVHGCQSAKGLTPLQTHRLVAPPLLWSEVTSALHQLSWRGTISGELATKAFERLLAAPIGPQAPANLGPEAWRVADALGWAKTYDAEYVALARLLDCPLLTLDNRLRRGAARLVKVIGPTEL